MLYQLSYIPERPGLSFLSMRTLLARPKAPLATGGVVPGGVNTGGSRGHSSVGRASRWQREGQEFESPCLHHERLVLSGFFCSLESGPNAWYISTGSTLDDRARRGEESPGFTGQGCRITSCRGDSKESATETYRSSLRRGARVKSRGKSSRSTAVTRARVNPTRSKTARIPRKRRTARPAEQRRAEVRGNAHPR